MYKFHLLSFIVFTLLIMTGCEAERHDYHYVVQNLTDSVGPIYLTYQTAGDANIKQKTLEENELFEIFKRENVSGGGIWNIETGSVLYAVPSLVATNEAGTKMTEDLSDRSFWPPNPDKEDKEGYYRLAITDKHFILEKQSQYKYIVSNLQEDTLFVTGYMEGLSRRKDTLLAGEQKEVGEAEIFTYSEEYRETDKYKLKKLSGISSLILKYQENSRTIDLKNYQTLNLQIEKDRTIIPVDKSYFE